MPSCFAFEVANVVHEMLCNPKKFLYYIRIPEFKKDIKFWLMH